MSAASGPKFRFGRTHRSARDGETLLASLARHGWPNLVRSIRYHRPRGPFCGTGDCTGCLVRVGGQPNVRACQYRPRDGDRIRSENSLPGPGLDAYGVVDFLLPKGFDTLHGLRRPAFAVSTYQRFVRRLAGYGRPAPPTFRRPVLESRDLTADIVVIGAGRSGRAAAEGLVRGGSCPLLIDRSDPTAPLDGAEVLAGVTATFLTPPDLHTGAFTLLAFSPDGRGFAIRAPKIVVATGGYDGPLLFEGSDRPGVITADLALRVPELPFGDAVLVGGGDRAKVALERIGEHVRAVVAPGDIRPEVVARATDLGIPLYPRSRVVRARGRKRVRSLEIASRGEGGRSSLRCDSVVLAHRRMPNAQLFYQAGAARQWYSDPGAFYPELEAGHRSTVAGLWGVGSAAAPPDPAAADVDTVVRAVLGRPPSERATPPPTGPSLVPYYRELLAERRHGKWVVCACEDVLLQEIEEASRRGFRGMEVIKRYTGVGTGLCQGRYCVPEALLLLAALEGRTPPEVGTITQRPPLVPTPLVALAGLAGEFDGQEVP